MITGNLHKDLYAFPRAEMTRWRIPTTGNLQPKSSHPAAQPRGESSVTMPSLSHAGAWHPAHTLSIDPRKLWRHYCLSQWWKVKFWRTRRIVTLCEHFLTCCLLSDEAFRSADSAFKELYQTSERFFILRSISKRNRPGALMRDSWRRNVVILVHCFPKCGTRTTGWYAKEFQGVRDRKDITKNCSRVLSPVRWILI
jgi:hypothetical protein